MELLMLETNCFQIILHYDDFNVVNPLGNKVSKYKLSAFYFVVGNISNKFRSRLKDIHLVLLCPSTLVTEYGCEKFLTPLLEDLYKLETEGLIIKFENQSFTFKGLLSTIIADNLAAHALGRFFCNFSTVIAILLRTSCSIQKLCLILELELLLVTIKTF